MSSIDLISLKIQILGGNLFKNPGFKSPSGKVNFFVPFLGQNEKGKEKKKNGKKFDPPPRGFEPQIFEQNFPAQDLNFEGD